MILRVGLLLGGTLLIALFALVVASLFGAGNVTYVWIATAMAICLLPALGTLIVGEIATQGKPELVGIAFLAGTIFRMVVVAVLAIGLSQQVEFFRGQGDWLNWVVFFYLVVLALETTLVVVGRKNPTA